MNGKVMIPFAIAITTALMFYIVIGQANGPTVPNPSLSISGCGAPSDGYVPTWDSSGFCIDWVPIASVSSATLNVDEDGIEVITNVTTLDFRSCLDVATSIATASVSVDILECTLSTDYVWAGVGNVATEVALSALTVGTASALASTTGCAPTTYATALSDAGVLGCQNPTLGTDTSGNYVASVGTGAGLTGGAGGSEGAALGLSLNLVGAISDGECLIWASPAIDAQACGGSATFPVYAASTVFDAAADGINITTTYLRWIGGNTPTLDVITGTPWPVATLATTATALASTTGCAAGTAATAITVEGVLGCDSFYATIEDEGTPLAPESTLNFAGAGVSCAPDTGKTTCTIAGGAAQDAWLSIRGTAGNTVTADSSTYVGFFTSSDGTVIATGSNAIDSLDFSINIANASLAQDAIWRGSTSNQAEALTLSNCAANARLTYSTTTHLMTCATLAIGDLSDVTTTTPQDGQVFVYSGAGGWANATVSGDGTLSSTGVLTISNAATADAATSDPADCAANRVAIAQDTAWALTCILLSDDYIPNTITIDLAAAATALAADPPNCGGTLIWAKGIDASGAPTCTGFDPTDATLTNDSVWVGDGANFAASTALSSCSSTAQMLRYNTTTNAFSCGTLVAGNYATLSGDTLNVDPELALKSYVAYLASPNADTDDGILFINWPAAATLGAVNCQTTTGTATISADIRSMFATSAGNNVFSAQPCTTAGTRITTFQFSTVSADQRVVFTFDAVSTVNMAFQIVSATGTVDD